MSAMSFCRDCWTLALRDASREGIGPGRSIGPLYEQFRAACGHRGDGNSGPQEPAVLGGEIVTRTEYRITGSAEDAWPDPRVREIAEQEWRPLQGYDFTWHSDREYPGAQGVRAMGDAAAHEFYENIASKWPSATFTSRTVTTTSTPWKDAR